MSEQITLEGKLLFPSEYVGAADLQGKDFKLQIDHLEVSDLRVQGGGKMTKPVLHFRNARKKLVMNKTNAKTIAAMHGGEATAWGGKWITIFPTKDRFGNKMVDCVRVRPTAPQQANEPAPAQQTTPELPSEPSLEEQAQIRADEMAAAGQGEMY